MRAEKTQTEIRQEQIAAAALELMARHGPKSLNLVRLARKVGIVPSAIYRHFPGKDAVLEAVLELIALRLQENVEAVREETLDALERLRRLLTPHVQLIQNHTAIPRIVFSEEIFNGHTKRRQQVHGVIQGYLRAVAELISEGQRDGSVRADVPAHTAALLFLGIIHPAVVLWLTSDGAFDVAAHAKKAWQVFREMLTAPAGASAAPPRSMDHESPAKKQRHNQY